MNLVKIIPMAFVMIAGPQILSAIFLATSENWKRNSIAYVFGAALSITATITLGYFAGKGASDEGSSDNTLYIVILILLVAAALHVYKTRETAKPPSWMGKLQTADPRLSFKLGFLLLGVFPTDILTSLAVGGFLSAEGDPWWHLLPFLTLTLLALALPAFLVASLGQRAQVLMPKVRDWMSDNSWVVSEVVIVFFILITINSLAG